MKRPWKPCLSSKKCECLDNIIEKKKKSNRTGLSEGKPLAYPWINQTGNKKFLKTFQIKYEGTLSLKTKAMLNSFKHKYIYYAIDDILYCLNWNLEEQEKLLTFLYSSMLSLHNNFSINFFDIWIDTIYINNTNKNNRFLTNDIEITYIKLNLYYMIGVPIKKAESIW